MSEGVPQRPTIYNKLIIVHKALKLFLHHGLVHDKGRIQNSSFANSTQHLHGINKDSAAIIQHLLEESGWNWIVGHSQFENFFHERKRIGVAGAPLVKQIDCRDAKDSVIRQSRDADIVRGGICDGHRKYTGAVETS